LYRRIRAFAAVKPVPVIVTGTVALAMPLTGEMAVTVAAVALETVNDVDVVPPSGFVTTSVQAPAVTPLRANVLLRIVGESVP
jgi:hypothetical protein